MNKSMNGCSMNCYLMNLKITKYSTSKKYYYSISKLFILFSDLDFLIDTFFVFHFGVPSI